MDTTTTDAGIIGARISVIENAGWIEVTDTTDTVVNRASDAVIAHNSQIEALPAYASISGA